MAYVRLTTETADRPYVGRVPPASLLRKAEPHTGHPFRKTTVEDLCAECVSAEDDTSYGAGTHSDEEQKLSKGEE